MVKCKHSQYYNVLNWFKHLKATAYIQVEKILSEIINCIKGSTMV